MKKLLAIILTAAFALSLAACGSSGSGGTGSGGSTAPGTGTGGSSAAKTIAEDDNILAMSFTPPTDYVSVERTIGKYTDGSIEEKEIDYFFDEDQETMLGFAFATGVNIGDYYTLDELDSAQAGDKTFYFVQTGTETVAIAQVGDDIYAIDYASDEDGTEYVKKIIEDIKFTDNKDTADNNWDLPGITYSTDGLGNLVLSTNRQAETPDGEITEQVLGWSYGDDKLSPDYRLGIYLYKNTSFDDVKSEDKVYEEREINGVKYMVRIPDDDEPYAYYTQQGDDLYLIMNVGTSNGLWTNRSDESYQAFEKLLNSISFK